MTGQSEEEAFDEFCSSCLQIEEQALRRVSQLAARRRPHSMSSPKTPSFLNSPPSSPPHHGRERKASLPNKLRSKRSRRPSTAPDPNASPHTKESSEDISQPSSPASNYVLSRTVTSPVTSPALPPVVEPQSLPAPRAAFMHHPRSTSTDSALSRKQYNTPRMPSIPTLFPCDIPGDSQDESIESTRKTRGLFRGILRKGNGQ